MTEGGFAINLEMRGKDQPFSADVGNRVRSLRSITRQDMPLTAINHTRNHIAASVREVIRTYFPADYCSLCHVFAVVGANLATIALEREFRPVAGLAAIDSGANQLIVMADDRAFANQKGGAYHCWIESSDHLPFKKVLIDLTFGHNHMYARKNGLPWAGGTPPRYLWGYFDQLVIAGAIEDLRPDFGKNRIWLCETDAGVSWMARHLEANLSGYVNLTAAALKIYRRRLPSARFNLIAPLLEPSMLAYA